MSRRPEVLNVRVFWEGISHTRIKIKLMSVPVVTMFVWNERSLKRLSARCVFLTSPCRNMFFGESGEYNNLAGTHFIISFLEQRSQDGRKLIQTFISSKHELLSVTFKAT